MAIPNAMRWRIAKLEGLSKQKINLTPNSGQTAVSAGQVIITDLPYSSLCDLASFEMRFTGQTVQGPGVVTGCRVYSFPRYIQSIIQSIEIRFNNKTVQHITDYNMVYNTLADLTQGNEGSGKRNIENYDPSKKFFDIAGVLTPRIGFPEVLDVDKTNDIGLDRQSYVIKNWLGLLGGNASTTCIDTNIIGTVQIRITLAPATCLILGRAQTNAVTNVAGAPLNYTLSDINFSIMKYDMPESFYDEVRRELINDATYSLFFPHYNTFSGQAATTKANSTRFSISSQSLDYLIGTFLVTNREIPQLPYSSFAAWNTAETNDAKIAAGQTKTFNQSVYFQRNGEYLGTSQWDVGGSRLPAVPETVFDCFNSTLQAFNLHNDTLGGCHAGLQSVRHFAESYFTSVLSLQWSGENDGVYMMSGLNTKELPVSISWITTASQPGAVAAVAGAYNVTGTNGSYGLPFIIAAETKQVNIKAGRQIEVY